MDKTPKVSVIVPVFKVEEYLNACVRSITGQTYKNLEIILVDDGSPDGCGKMCDELAAKDDRIKVVHKKNGGLSSARNAGMEIATGEFIEFVDSDDTLNFQTTEILLKAIMQTGSDVSMCGWRSLKDIKNPRNKEYDTKNLEIQEFVGDEVFDLLFNRKLPLIMTAWAKLYKAEIVKKVGFSEEYKVNEDEYFIHYLLDQTDKLAFVPLPLYNNTYRESSLTGTKFNVKRLAAARARGDRWQFCEKNRPQFAQKALKQYLLSLASGYTKLKKAKGDKDTLNKLLEAFNEGYKKLEKKGLFVKLFKNSKFGFAVALKLKEILKK